MARKKRLAVALAALGCLHAGSVWALGLGELSLKSFLNEPLQAEVGLLDAGTLDEDQIRVRIATADDFDRLGIDRSYFLTGISFEVRVDKNGRGTIILTSEDPVLEPYLDFIIEARRPSGRLLRNYTVLVDPPAFDTQATSVSATVLVAEVEGPSPEDPRAEQAGTTGAGTRVRLRESNLAPGAMPERNFSADTAQNPAPGARYMIRRDETLWIIAQRARPEGVSVQQAMLEIQRLNPDAFIDGNINRIKAGYIIYLPDRGDVGETTEAGVAAVLAEVRQQNEDWRAGRASTPSSGGPALRISEVGAVGEAAPVTDADTTAVANTSVESTSFASSGDALASLADTAAEQREREAFGQQLTRLTDRLDALERLVEVKDEEIAALQRALVEAQVAPQDFAESSVAAPEVVPALAAPAVVPAAPVQPVPESAAASTGLWPYIVGGGLFTLLAGVLLWRRRQATEVAGETTQLAAAPRQQSKQEADAFADIQLQDHAMELDDDESTSAASPAVDSSADAASPRAEMPRGGQRGYGEHKHDEYASDVDAGDALAESDIYIAYGRYTQAMELLRKATRTDPDNSAYRLKLLGLAAETGDHNEADQQMIELQRIGDAVSIARAERLLADASGDFGSLDGRDAKVPSIDEEPDFLGLEIEDGVAEELDLSADFEKSRAGGDSSEDDFVFADDGDPMSTKLDLARAYIDMGDDDGARQILDEVIGGGNSEQQQDARELLERLG